MNFKYITTILVALALSGCLATPNAPPATIYDIQIVKVPTPVFLDTPKVDKFESSVKMLTDQSTTSDVVKAFKSDWLILMERDALYTNFFSNYEKARQNERAKEARETN